jgi:CheY-like chemotaxis protein
MPRILVLEDEPLISMLLGDWLTELGCETVGPAGSVADALGLVERGVLDGAILDVSLGNNEDCYAVADLLATRGVPFALATGHGPQGVAERYRRGLILAKPFDFTALKGVLSQLLAAKAAG